MISRKRMARTIAGELLFLLLTLFVLIPVYYFIIGAFKGRLDIVKFPLSINLSMIKDVGFSNFSYVFKRMKMFQALLNTGAITIFSLVIVVICGSLAGFVISRVNRKFFSAVYTTLVALMVVPFIGCLIPLVIQSTQLKTYNSLIGCILIQSAWNLPFAVFLFTGFMRALPKELEESAYIDGCTMIGTYFKIFLPLLAPVTATCCIRGGVGIWNDYLVSNSLLNSVQTPTLMVGINMFFGARKTEYGYAFAGIILASLPIVILFLFLQKYFIKGIVAGAVKG
ncbi:MAG: carbohydrate ABC transporter permease [Sphaerochaetaceae bacterium]|jgi:raffinose/stachyose/melibiose transport system permease protein|nr:carbohydrate ABC transporter permease [Sphaerochaetaceae bacterium]MDD4007570.1 carbohydrate ABC transporter permease [Sphaerochaetaceae bacterium]MDD4396718.1 carbohydrate ABC transporter permease [Sphaerochaetaceae bacterium]